MTSLSNRVSPSRARAMLLAGVTAVLTAMLLSTSLLAAPQPEEKEVAIGVKGGEKIAAQLKRLRPDLPIESVTATPADGIVAVNLSDGSTYYGTADGRYLLSGDLFSLTGVELVNVSESERSVKRREVLAAINTGDTVTFAPAKETKASLYVFTDVDCGYCRKLHQEVPALNAKGIAVHYLAYPRAGVGSKSYDKIVSAWCADDRQDALTRLKAGQTIADRTCANPVADQYGLGRALGISGTPAIILQDGTLLPGYLPAEQLAETMGI
ncbi:MAG: DsbC family protein [Pseudomonadota bacterium]